MNSARSATGVRLASPSATNHDLGCLVRRVRRWNDPCHISVWFRVIPVDPSTPLEGQEGVRLASIQGVPRKQAHPDWLRKESDAFPGEGAVLRVDVAGDDAWPRYLQRFPGMLSKEGSWRRSSPASR